MTVPQSAESAPTERNGAAPDVSLRRMHVFTVVLQWASSLSRSIIPLGVLYLQHRDRGGRLMPIIAGGILLLTAMWSIASYFAMRYGLTADSLVVRSGVLRRQSRVIPFSRIQSVNVRQSALQRVFGVAELRVETATQGAEAEAVLSVLRWKDAQSLREELVAERQSALHARQGTMRTTLPAGALADGSEPIAAATQASVLVASISVEELMVAGGTSNNIGVLIALLISGCERFGSTFFDELTLPGGVGSPIEAFAAAMGNVWLLTLLIVVVAVPILFASWLVSVAGSVVRYYGFTLERVGQDLRRRHGLFSRVEASIPMARAQALRFRQSMLRRPFGRGELFVVSAGSVAKGDGTSGGLQHLMPIIRVEHVGSIVTEVFPDANVEALLASSVGSGSWRRAAALSWLRLASKSSFTLLLIVGVLVAWRGNVWWSLAWLLPAAWLLAGARWRARGLALVPGYVLVREGGIARTTVILPERKLQLIEVQQGPLQRLFGVATLHLTTAGSGGLANMVDLPLAEARALRDDLAARLPGSVRERRRSAGAVLQSARSTTSSLALESRPYAV